MKPLLAAATVALAVTVAVPASASPAPACEAQVAEMQAAWKAVPHPYSKLAEKKTRADHDHNAMAETYMYGQLRQADAQCKGGNDHEALLRLDVVRVWLKLPEIAHPTEHNYQPK